MKVVTREGHLHNVQEGKLHNEEHQEGYLLRFVNLEERLHLKQMGTKFGWVNLQILNSSDYQGGSSFKGRRKSGYQEIGNRTEHCDCFKIIVVCVAELKEMTVDKA